MLFLKSLHLLFLLARKKHADAPGVRRTACGGGPQAAQLAECYWMALARDVPFADYASAEVTVAAAGEIYDSVASGKCYT